MPSSGWWLVVEICDSALAQKPLEGKHLRILFAPNGKIFPEQRELDKILSDAVEKGWETSYCSTWHGISQQRREELVRLVLRWLRDKFNLNIRTFDVTVEVVARIGKY